MLPSKFLVLLTLAPVVMSCVTYLGLGQEFLVFSTARLSGAVPITLQSIQVGGNGTYTIENGYYAVNDTIRVKENGTLIIRNAVVEFNASSSTILQCYDNATVNVLNSTIYHDSGYAYSYSYGKTLSNITQSSFLGYSYFYLYDTSNTSVGNSNAYSFYATNNATVSLTSTNARYLYCYSFTKVSVVGSVINYVYVSDSSNFFLADSSVSGGFYMYFKRDSNVSISLPSGLVGYWSLYENNSVVRAYLNVTMMDADLADWDVYCYDTSVVSVEGSSLDALGAYGNSTVLSDHCTMNSLYAENYGNVTLLNSTVSSNAELYFLSSSIPALSLQKGHFNYWNLYGNSTVTVSNLNLTLQDARVDGWSVDAYSSEIYLADSYVEYLYADENSTLSVSNSTIDGAYSYTSSSLVIAWSTVSWADTYGSSTLSVADSTLDGVYAYGNSSVSLSRVQLEYLYINDYASVVISDSVLTSNIGLAFTADSNVSLNSLPVGWISYWNLYENASVLTAYINLTVTDTIVQAWGSFYAYQDSVLSIGNSLVNYVYVYDNSSLSVAYSSIYEVVFSLTRDTNVTFSSLPTGLTDYWNLYENCSVSEAYVNLTLSHSRVGEWGFYTYDSTTLSFKSCAVDFVYAYGSSNVSIKHSDLNYVEAFNHAAVSLSGTTVQDDVYVSDYSSLNLTNSSLQSRLYLEFKGDSAISNLSLARGLVDSWNLYENATVARAYLNLTVLHTTLSGWGFYVYDYAALSITNSRVEYLSANDFCTATLNNSTLENAYAYGHSQLLVTSPPAEQSVVTYLYTYGMSTATLLESRVGIIRAQDYSTIYLTSSDYGVAHAFDQATVQISSFLQVHVIDAGSQNVVNANVTVADKNGAVLYSNQTDSYGWANLTLVGEVIDVLGSHPGGNYSVTAQYTAYSAVETLEMSKNQQIDIGLQFVIISELTTAPTIALLLISSSVLAVALRKRARGFDSWRKHR